MKRKVCVVVTARPSYSRVRSVLEALRAHPDVELQLVVAASALLDRYGQVIRVMEQDGFEIEARIHMVVEGGGPATMAKTTGLGLIELSTAFTNLDPDVVLTIADRYETLATAVAASYMNIPVAHLQGGEVTGSIDDKVRHAVTKLSDLHFVATGTARQRVIGMGEDPDAVFCTGCPSIDLARQVLDHDRLDFDPYARYGGVGSAPDLSNDYVVVLQHPVTSECEAARQHVEETLGAVQALPCPVLWFWPNVDAGSDGTSEGIRAFREQRGDRGFHFFKNMEPLDFLSLIRQANCLVGNSSVGIREAEFLEVPVVNIGSRQQGRERGGNVIDAPYSQRRIRVAAIRQMERGRCPSRNLYGDGRSGPRIARLLGARQLVQRRELVG